MIVQSKPVAQVYRLFGALIALLLVMAIGFTIARWRSSQPAGSPYGGLAAVAPSTTVPTIAAPARVAASVPAATPAAAVAPSASVAPPAPVALPPVAMAPNAATTDPTRNAPRVIALDKSTVGAAPLPAPAAAVAAATASQAAVVAPVPVPVAAAVAATDPVAPAPAATAPAPAVPAHTAMASATPAADTDAAPGGLININTASAEALNHLPGGGHIGKTIVRHRPYASVQDLVDHRVLRAGDFARIRAHITAN